MRTTLLLLSLIGITALVMAPVYAAGSTSSVSYQKHWINHTRVHVIWVNLNDQTIMVKPALAWNTVGRRQSFISFLSVHQPLAQITGSYFSLQTNRPIGDVMIDGVVRWRGPVGTALALRPDNRAEMVNIPYGWFTAWAGREQVIQGGVRLVKNGRYAVYPRPQGFRDPGLFRRATRTAVGIDTRNRLLMVAVGKPILLSELAGIMKALGCKDAMSLDGGTSTGLAHGVNVIFTPGRTLSSVLMVVRRPPRPTPPPPVDNPVLRAAPTPNDTYLEPAVPPGTPEIGSDPEYPQAPVTRTPLPLMRDVMHDALRAFMVLPGRGERM